jgi:hypothetical protein
MKTEWIIAGIIALMLLGSCEKDSSNGTSSDNLPDITGYPIVGTNETTSYDSSTAITKPSPGTDYYGQNSNYPGTTPSYTSNDDGTVTDNVTSLMWTQDLTEKKPYSEVISAAKSCTTGGHTDWRVPTIKELYSLILFSGKDPSNLSSLTGNEKPFIDNGYFTFAYSTGNRVIDVQVATTTTSPGVYKDRGLTLVYGVNFADGRIKAYGTVLPDGSQKQYNYMYVRGNTTYGTNSFTDNGNKTITDKATGLMWAKYDSQKGMNWKDALKYADTATVAAYIDWRLPDAKELQSIVDYARSPQTTNSAAIDPVFSCTSITNEAGQADYPYYWTNTTHAMGTNTSEGGNDAAYICFGWAMGYSDLFTIGKNEWADVHGAGAQRSEPKSGVPSSTGFGPQGDAERILNYVRLVRAAK